MICPQCQTENEVGRKFCAECGTRLTLICPSCGTPNTPGTKFCGECGTALSADAPAGQATSAAAVASAAPAPSAERRLVTVLFADLVGFTTLAEDRDPEETRDVLNRYFEAARNVIARYGGTVEKFIGDAVMAVWGTPVAFEDDAERAVRAALELVDAVGAIETGSKAHLAARAGVLTGEAAVTLGAEGHGMVAGDIVNTASRLQSVAPPGAVLVGDATRHAAAEAIVFEPVGPQELKGKQLPVDAWRALRVVAKRGGEGRAEAVEAPFVGRDDELRLLKELLHLTTSEQRTRLVSITGPAGIGKSRLLWELLKYVDGVVEDIYWHEGRSPSYGEGVSFWALGEMVRQRAGIAETDDPSVSRERLHQAVEQYVSDESERGWIEPRLAGLLGLEETPSGEREQLFAAWRTFFERISELGTTVLAFEDLHWADPGLLDFIEHLLEWARSRPILVITLARPEFLERRPTWGTRQRAFSSVRLEPMGPEPMAALVNGLAPGVPIQLVDRIIERSEGMPLYAVELVRMLVAEGRLVRRDDRFEIAGTVDQLQVPASLQALLAARLDALEPDDRALLQTAAVLGLTFTAEALSAVSSAEPEAVRAALARMAQRELLTLEGDPRSPERGQYRFLQGLSREVAYGMLARPERRARHVAAARYYEQLGDDELAGVLASHYVEAYRSAPAGPEAAALAAQARVALRGAADRAAALHSHEQAIAYVEQALGVTSDESERVPLWERASGSYEALARTRESADYAERALVWHRQHSDRERAAAAVLRLGRVLIHSGQPERGVDLLEREVAGHADLDPSPALAGLLAELARGYLVSELEDGITRAAETAERALVIAERHDLEPIVVQGLVTRGAALGVKGRQREGVALLRAAAEMAREGGDALAYLRAQVNLSFLLSRDDPRAAIAAASAGADEAKRLGELGWLAALVTNQAEAAWLTGEWQMIEALYRDLIDQLGPADNGAGLQALYSTVLAYRGQPDEAARLLEPIFEATADVTEPQVVQAKAMSKALHHMAAGRLAEALPTAIEAIGLAESGGYSAALIAARSAFWLGDRERHAEVVAAWARVKDRGRVIDASAAEIRAGALALEGRSVDAVAAFEETVRRWREVEMPLDLALALFALSVVGGSSPRSVAAEKEAQEILRRLGADHLIKIVTSARPAVAAAIVGRARVPAAPTLEPDREAQRR